MNKILKTKILLLFLLTFLVMGSVSAKGDDLRVPTETGSLVLQVAQKRVTISMKGATLRVILHEVQKQSGISILFKDAEVDGVAKKDVAINNLTVAEALTIILNDTALEYKITGNSISIFKKNTQPTVVPKRISVNGKILDAEKKPIAGATIVVAGSSRGAISDAEGKFAFMTFEHDALEVTYTGKKNLTYNNLAKNNKDIILQLEDDAMAMDDVIVTGYENVNRKDMVGSVTQLNAKDILNQNYTSIEQMLQGQVAGMMVTSESARVGTSPKIQIRGTSTLIGNRDPLWVVDGVIQEDPIAPIDPNSLLSDDLRNMVGSQISWLNPMDIETITVLKDASATAIYGAKASNGVIVITTKKNATGRLSVSYSGTVKVNTKPNYGQFDYMNSKERVNFVDEAFDAGLKYKEYPFEQLQTYEGAKLMYANGKISKETLIARRNRLETVNTDWFDALTRAGVSQTHNLSVSGGTDLISYNASVGYSDTKGQEIGNDSENMTGRISLNITPHPKIKINVALNGTSTKNSGFSGVSPINYATNTSRNIELYDEFGDLSFYQTMARYTYNSDLKSLSYNIINERDNSSATVDLSRIAASLTLNWKINDWITYNFSGGYTKNTNNSEQYRGERTFFAAQKYRGYDYGTEDSDSPKFQAAWYPFGGQYVSSNTVQNSFNIQNKVLLSKNFNNGHRLSGMVAFEIRSSESVGLTSNRAGYVPERGDKFLPPVQLNNHKPLGGSSNSGVIPLESTLVRATTKSNFMSVFATLAYVMKDKYVFNANVRNDFSNKFGQDTNRRLDPTYSLGASWRVSEEDFMRDKISWFSDFVLKATFGIQGNAPTVSSELTLLRQGVMYQMNQYYSVINTIPNPNLSWERTNSWNFATEFTLFKKFYAKFDYYMRTSNAMTTRKITPEFGLPTMLLNEGQLLNDGIEFSLSFSPVRTKNVTLNVSLNSSKNWNSIGENQMPVVWNDYLTGQSSTFLREGYPLGAMWSYDFAGLSPTNGAPTFNNLDLRPGDVRGPEIDPLPYLVYSGSSIPSFTGGLTLGFRYKSLTLGTSFALILGKMKRLPSPYKALEEYYALPIVEQNLSKQLANRWKKPGDELTTFYPAIQTSAGTSSTQIPGSIGSFNAYQLWEMSDAMVVNSSFLRCREIKLTWQLRPELAKRLSLKSLSVTGSFGNPFVIANKRFNGFDPELNNTVMPKDFSIGLSIGF